MRSIGARFVYVLRSDSNGHPALHYVGHTANVADHSMMEPGSSASGGLKIVLTIGTKKGEGLMRRLAVSPDPVVMLDAALQEAAKNAGVELVVEDGTLYLKVLNADC